MAKIKVVIVGASGVTGSSIVDALLKSTEPSFELRSLTRPASLSKPAVRELEERGVEIVPLALDGPEDEIVQALAGIDTVISTVLPMAVDEQIHLANAAKIAGVTRFVPSCWATIAPPEEVMLAREWKEKVINHLLKIRIGYTIIDVGLWYQVTLPLVPSGRLDYCVSKALRSVTDLGKDRNVTTAMTHINDIGRYVARIIADPRTLNKKIFAYNESLERTKIYDLVESISSEKLVRRYVLKEEVENNIAKAPDARKVNPGDITSISRLAMEQYFDSIRIRGDNTPEYAQYLGYLDCKDLYPDFEIHAFEDFIHEALDGKAKPVLMDYS